MALTVPALWPFWGRRSRRRPAGSRPATAEERTVRRFYEEVCNEGREEVAPQLFTEDHRFHGPQGPTGDGPQGVVATVSAHRQAMREHRDVEDLFSTGDRVVVRWVGTGAPVGLVQNVADTQREVWVDAISIHRLEGGKIAETWEAWDTEGSLRTPSAVAQPT
ncbi:MAG TPA: ester cyclase [Acidimicrobiales bacterium]|nr:ester cyclase [Acidimicrobiales bacterium]